MTFPNCFSSISGAVILLIYPTLTRLFINDLGWSTLEYNFQIFLRTPSSLSIACTHQFLPHPPPKRRQILLIFCSLFWNQMNQSWILICCIPRYWLILEYVKVTSRLRELERFVSICRISECPVTTTQWVWTSCPFKNDVELWLVWLSGLSTSLRTEGSPVWFPVRAHFWVAGQVPSRGWVRGNHTLMFLSLALFLSPFPSV